MKKNMNEEDSEQKRNYKYGPRSHV